MLNELLSERNLPLLQTRNEMLELLLREEYGYLPANPDHIEWRSEKARKNFCAGKANDFQVTCTATWGDKQFVFPFHALLPTAPGKYPFFVMINFRPDIPDVYLPAEELIDHGYAVLYLYYRDITADNDDFTDGLAGVLYKDGKRKSADPGKIAMWAWGMHRLLDYAETLDCLNMDRAIAAGHSRLGKTALLAAATDERFYCGHSNDSGCSGAAISRAKIGESVAAICKKFPYWFCENYYKYAENESIMPFDQHYLIASIAPRLVHVSSAIEDKWADPDSEFLACVAASSIYDSNGFICEDRLPIPGDRFHEGRIGYDLRNGTHYFSREDWLNLIAYLKKHE
ncbi:MAG: hypothetical protein IJ043_06290 [Clostridia bacterium]|nr:hypothetical protein [Clostridia bacterium]